MTMLPLNINDVSPQNKFDVITHLLCTPETSRNETASAVGLSAVTVGKVVSRMLERGLLDATSAQGQRGRSTEMLTPRKTLKALVVLIKESVCHANFILADRTRINVLTHHRNESFQTVEDVDIFLSKLRSAIQEEENIFGVYVVCELRSFSYREIDFKSSLGQTPDRIMTLEEVMGICFNTRYPSKTVLYVDINEYIRYSLYSNGSSLSKNAQPKLPEERDERSIANYISSELISLFEVIVPDIVAIVSDKITADRRFVDYLLKRVTQKAELPQELLPTFICDKDTDMIGDTVFDIGINAFAKNLSGME